MNIQKLFEAIKREPDLSTILIVVLELENQGYEVIVNNKIKGSKEILLLEEENELQSFPFINGTVIKITGKQGSQIFKIHFLDIDSIAITDVESIPLQFNPIFGAQLFQVRN